jgi:hypothetical protein
MPCSKSTKEAGTRKLDTAGTVAFPFGGCLSSRDTVLWYSIGNNENESRRRGNVKRTKSANDGSNIGVNSYVLLFCSLRIG